MSSRRPRTRPRARRAIKAHAEWLVCKDICVPEKGDLDISFPVSKAQPRKNPMFQAHIDRARNQLPVDVDRMEVGSVDDGPSRSSCD